MRNLILATAMVTAGTFGVHAADLIIDEPAPMATPAASSYGLYFELLGGASLPGTLEYSSGGDPSDDVPVGAAIAGVVGFGTGFDGLSVEGDLFLTQRDYEDGDYTLTTGTAMVDLKYTVSLNDTFGLYGAIGLGGVYLHDEEAGGGTVYVDGWGAGYLLKAGLTAKVAEQISLVGEVRYANTFSPIIGEGSEPDEQIGTAAVLIGLHFGF